VVEAHPSMPAVPVLTRTQTRVLASVAFGAYVLLTCLLTAHHEPWRDEADAWVEARDATVAEIVWIAARSGTPGLWYYLQVPFARTGFPYETQAVLNLLLVFGAVGLIMFRSPLPLPVRVTLPFGYHLSFEYPVVARNYGLGLLLCFLAITLDDDRRRRPWLYGLVLLLLSNVSVHFLLFSLVLGGLFALEAWRERALRARSTGLLLAGLGVVAAIAQVWPPSDGQFKPGLFTEFAPRRLLGPYKSFFPEGLSAALAPLVLAAYAGIVGFLLPRPRALLFFLGAFLGLSYLFVFKYVGGARHYGLLLVLLVMAAWLGEREPARDGSLAQRLRLRWLAPRARTVGYAGLTLGLLGGAWVAAPTWRDEIDREFSAARTMARYLEAHGLASRRIVAHQSSRAVAVLPHLPGTKFWYPERRDFGTFMLWDRTYAEGQLQYATDAVLRMKETFADWQDPDRGVLLLLNQELPDAARHGYRLIYRTPGTPFRADDESFSLYAPLPRDG
jgi:hypothetical protein